MNNNLDRKGNMSGASETPVKEKGYWKKWSIRISGLVIAALLVVGSGAAVRNTIGGPQGLSENELRMADALHSSGWTQLISRVQTKVSDSKNFSLKEVPKYSGEPTVEVERNRPHFARADLKTKAYERLSDLDSLGRCTTTIACIGRESMPKGKRGSISEIHPTGWHSVEYRSVESHHLYNRCHLIGWQLTGDDAIARNLITGTRYMNVEGMEPYESRVAQYIRSSGNHVVYRSTPIFQGKEMVARGVHLEAQSVEDHGRGVSFNVFCYNVQPDIVIDYKTGDSHSKISGDQIKSSTRNAGNGSRSSKAKPSQSADRSSGSTTYIINENTRKFHKPSCRSVQQMAGHNKERVKASRKALIDKGYEPCGNCHP